MKKSIILILTAAFSFLLHAEEISADKLMLHYDFSKHQDGIVPDLSGNGHNGQMRGNFQDVTVGKYTGLAFNRKDTAILPAAPKGLRLNGPLTIAIRLRISPEQALEMRKSSPLVFGTPNLRSVRRNYLLFFDYGKRLELDISDGSKYTTLTALNLADGKIHDVVYVVNPPNAQIYIDGKCVKESAKCNITPTDKAGSDNPIIGCWKPGSGHFCGDLFELRLYNQALTNSEVAAFSNPDIKK